MKRVALAMSLLAVVACGAGPSSTPTPLRAAAASGDAAEVRRLLAAHADPNGAESPGWPPLGIAARRGHVEVMQVLLAAGADPDRRDDSGNHWTPLTHAIHKHQNAAVRALLDGGAKVDEMMAGGATALMFAAAYGNADVVRDLLEHGADPYREMPDGVTALSNAAGGGALFDITDGPHLGTCFPEVVRLLRQRAPDQKLRRTFFNRMAVWLGSKPGCADAVGFADDHAGTDRRAGVP
jgi:hypothetical protein